MGASCGRKSPAAWRAAISIGSTSRPRSASEWISEARRLDVRAQKPQLKLDPHAHGRIDVLGLLEPVREARVNVRQCDARVEVDALDRPVVDQERERVQRSGTSIA